MDDSVTPLAAKQKMEAVAPHAVQMVRYDDSPALFKATAGGALFNWIKQELRPGARINSSVATTGRGRRPSVH
jgi:hypothetical protein